MMVVRAANLMFLLLRHRWMVRGSKNNILVMPPKVQNTEHDDLHSLFMARKERKKL